MVQGETVRHNRRVAIAAGAIAVVLLLLVAGGCSKKQGAAPTSSTTAKGGLSAASSSLSTAAPDAKLLLVQTAQSVTSTSTPVWAYLFGSPSTNKTYLVYVSRGKSMGASQYGSAGLTKTQWQAVPGTDAWAVDSDAAYQKAVAASSLKNPSVYDMGMVTYAASSKTKAFTWYVSLRSGTTTATVEVDAKTGKATAK